MLDKQINFLSAFMAALMLLNIIGVPIFSHQHTEDSCHDEQLVCCSSNDEIEEFTCCSSDLFSDFDSTQEEKSCCWEELTLLQFCFDSSFEGSIKVPHFITAFIQESSSTAIENTFRNQVVSTPKLFVSNTSKKLSLYQVYRI